MLPLNYDYINKEAKRCMDEEIQSYRDKTKVNKKVLLQQWIEQITIDETEKLIENTIDKQWKLKLEEANASYSGYSTTFEHEGLPTQGFFLYRWFNNNNEIIYVGKTTDLRRRMNDHKRDNTKINEAVRIEYVDVQHLGIQSSDNLEWLEDYFINLYHPKYNKRHNYSTFTVPEIPMYTGLQWTDITTKVFTLSNIKPLGKAQHRQHYLETNPTVITINYSLKEVGDVLGIDDYDELTINMLSKLNIKLEQKI